MATQKASAIHYLLFILVGCVCTFLSYMYAQWAGYISATSPPPPSGILFEDIVLDKSNRNEVETLLNKKEGKLMPKGEFVGHDLHTVRKAGETSGNKSALSFVANTWTLRVFFDEKGVAIAKELRW